MILKKGKILAELAAARFANELDVDMDNYKIPSSVLIDLSKAFDTLNHDILIFNLYQMIQMINHFKICRSLYIDYIMVSLLLN